MISGYREETSVFHRRVSKSLNNWGTLTGKGKVGLAPSGKKRTWKNSKVVQVQFLTPLLGVTLLAWRFPRGDLDQFNFQKAQPPKRRLLLRFLFNHSKGCLAGTFRQPTPQPLYSQPHWSCCFLFPHSFISLRGHKKEAYLGRLRASPVRQRGNRTLSVARLFAYTKLNLLCTVLWCRRTVPKDLRGGQYPRAEEILDSEAWCTRQTFQRQNWPEFRVGKSRNSESQGTSFSFDKCS